MLDLNKLAAALIEKYPDAVAPWTQARMMVPAVTAVVKGFPNAVCEVSNCNRQQAGVYDYCVEHVCGMENCSNPALDDDWCALHTPMRVGKKVQLCAVASCVKPAAKDNIYCFHHTDLGMPF